MHPAITPGRVAVITGGASGIGLAVAQLLADQGLHIALADRDEAALQQALTMLPGTPDAHFGQVLDVAEMAQVEQFREAVLARFGDVAILMNNAGTGGGGGAWSRPNGWRKVIGVNLWGVINGLQAFTAGMIDQGRPCAIVNTGSKQGITNPPGDAPYNVSKAGVRSVTESLAHELRGIEDCQVSAHLLVPGFTYTGLIKARIPDKPAAAWTPEQVAEQLLVHMAAGDFYAICPDNDVSVALDHARIAWNAGDLIHNRPALSRWHPDYVEAFDAHVEQSLNSDR